MTRYSTNRAFVLVVVVLSTLSASAQQIDWITDLDKAKQIAQETGRPIMYDFTAKWCGPCRNMDKDFWPRATVVELAGRFVAVKVDYDVNRAFARDYSVNAIPNVLFTDPWGTGLNRQVGFIAAREAEIQEKMRSMPHDFRDVLLAGKTLQTDADDLASLHKLAGFYQDAKLFWLATSYYGQIIKHESDSRKRENVLVNLAFNHLRLGEPGSAAEKFEVLRKEFPQSPQYDIFLFGLTLSHSKKHRRTEAASTLTELRTRFPQSKYIDLAEQNITGAEGFNRN